MSGRSAQDSLYGGTDTSGDDDQVPTPASNAITKYKTVTNDGLFDINSYVYKRVAANTNLAVNPQPLSISVLEMISLEKLLTLYPIILDL